MTDATDMSIEETKTRLVFLEQVVDRLMSIIAGAGTPQQIYLLEQCDAEWIRALKGDSHVLDEHVPN